MKEIEARCSRPATAWGGTRNGDGARRRERCDRRHPDAIRPPTRSATTRPFGFRGPSLNDLGQVAFQADLDDFLSSGVLTGPDAVADAVIRTGDKIRGKTVQSVSACREMLNARGQVAARVTFDDFSQAIIRATPRR